MRTAILIIAGHHIRRLVRRPGLVLFLAAVPLTLAFIESAAFSTAPRSGGAPPVPVLFADEDHSDASRAMEACATDGIGKDPLAVTHVESQAEGEQVFHLGDHTALIVAPAGFDNGLRDGRGVALKYFPRSVADPDAQVAAKVLETCVTLANGTLAAASTRVAGIRSLAAIGSASTSVAVDRPLPKPSDDHGANGFFAAMFPGLALFGMLFLSQAMAAPLLRDRARAIYARILTTPVRAWEVAGGSLAYLVAGLTALLILMGLLGAAVFQAQLTGIPTLMLLGIGFALCAAAIQLVIGASAKSERGAQSISAICVMMLSLFGGAFVPVANYPQPLRALASILPNGAAQAGMTRALTLNPTLAGVGAQVVTVWTWAAVLSLLAVGMQMRRPAR